MSNASKRHAIQQKLSARRSAAATESKPESTPESTVVFSPAPKPGQGARKETSGMKRAKARKGARAATEATTPPEAPETPDIPEPAPVAVQAAPVAKKKGGRKSKAEKEAEAQEAKRLAQAGTITEGDVQFPEVPAERYVAAKLPERAAVLLTNADALRAQLPRSMWNRAQQALERDALKVAQSLVFCGWTVERPGLGPINGERLGTGAGGRKQVSDEQVMEAIGLLLDENENRSHSTALQALRQKGGTPCESSRFAKLYAQVRTQRGLPATPPRVIVRTSGTSGTSGNPGGAKGSAKTPANGWDPYATPAAEWCQYTHEGGAPCGKLPTMRIVDPVHHETTDMCRVHGMNRLNWLRNEGKVRNARPIPTTDVPPSPVAEVAQAVAARESGEREAASGAARAVKAKRVAKASAAKAKQPANPKRSAKRGKSTTRKSTTTKRR